MSLRDVLKKAWFGFRGIDPESVVVTFATGPAGLIQEITEDVRALIPERRHFVVENTSGGAWRQYLQLRGRFRGLRIGMAAVALHTGPEYGSTRLAAFLLAPRKILAYNPRLERHHLQARTLISSWLFWRGVPLDRIHLRPRWLFPWRKDRTTVPREHRVVEGRPLSPLRSRVAVLTPYLPYPLSHGGAVRLFHLLREAAVEFDIFLFAFTETVEGWDLGPLTKISARIYLVGKPRYREPRWSTWNPPEVGEYRSHVMSRLLEDARREYGLELLQIEYSQLAPYGRFHSRAILVAHDITFDLYRQVFGRLKSAAAWWDWWRWRRFEQRVFPQSGHVVVMSDKDAALSMVQNAVVIPNGVDLDRFQPAPEQVGQRLLFIGSFRHFPNVTAFQFFAGEVWPTLLREFPEAGVTVVAGPDSLLHWQSVTGERDLPRLERCRLLGFVEDVKPLYEETNVVMVPTLVSAGTNVKVLEAMAMERAVVSTTSGCGGLGLEHGTSVWIADGAEAFADGVARLLRDSELRRSIALRARALAETRYSWRALGELQRRLWREMSRARLVIRPGTPADLDEVKAIQNASPEAARWPVEDYRKHDLLVAADGGSVIGFLVMRQVAPGEREILNLAVSPEWRAQGVGSRLVETAAKQAGKEMFLEVRESNLAARNLYKRLGFQEINRRLGYYANTPESAIVMRLRKC